MKKKLMKGLIVPMMMSLLVGCGYTAGTILENPKDGLTTKARDIKRSNILADQMWKSFYDEELNASYEYYPYKDNSCEMASVWHYTSVLSLYIRLVKLDPTNETLKTRLNSVIEGLEYYKEKRNDGYRVYAVNRGFKSGAAATGLNTNVYDDNMWIAREFLNAYDVLHDETLLTKAKEVTKYILDKGWDHTINPDTNEEWGGFYWGPYYQSKHTCSNAPFVSTLVRLSEITEEDITDENSYLNWAKKTYDFSYKTFRRADGLYGDMIGTERDTNDNTISHGSLDETTYTYNTGTMISGGAYLYKATSDVTYLNQAKATAETSFDYFANGELVDGVYQFPVSTTLWFNLTLFQGYYDLYSVDNSGTYLDKIQKSIDFAYNNYLVKNSLPVNWINGWTYGLEKDEYKDVMDETSNAETFALLAMYEDLQ